MRLYIALPDHLKLVDASVSGEPRRCAFCRRVLRAGARADAVTCTKRCRQKRARAQKEKVARKVSRARQVLSQSAINRAGFEASSVPRHVLPEDRSGSKRLLIVGRIRGREVRID